MATSFPAIPAPLGTNTGAPAVIQLVNPPQEPRCCCCGARNGLIGGYAFLLALSILSMVGTFTMTTFASGAVLGLTIAQSIVVLIGLVVALYAVVKANPSLLRTGTFVFIGTNVLSWILTVVGLVLMSQAATSAMTSTTTNSRGRTVNTVNINAAMALVTVNIAIGSLVVNALLVIFIANRMFAYRKYLLKIDQYAQGTGSIPANTIVTTQVRSMQAM